MTEIESRATAFWLATLAQDRNKIASSLGANISLKGLICISARISLASKVQKHSDF